MRKLLFSSYIKVYKCLQGKGLGKLPLVGKVNDFLYQLFKPKGDIALIEVQGRKINYNPHDMAVPRHLVMDGHYEKYETELFRKLGKTGDVVLDIGAHIGHYTLIAAEFVGKKGKVFALNRPPTTMLYL